MIFLEVCLKKTWTVVSKEIRNIFCHPSIYISIFVFSVGSALYFFLGGQFFVPGLGSTDLRFFFNAMPYLFVLIIPALTMGQWEQSALLFDESLPITEGVLVFSKWMAALIASVVILIPGFAVPFFVNIFGNLEVAQVFTGYFGIICFQAAACGLGIFLSILCGSPGVAFLVTSLVLGLMCLIHLVPVYLPVTNWIGELCKQLSFAWHFDAAGKGIIDFRDVFFYAVVTTALLLITTEIIKIKKRGCL